MSNQAFDAFGNAISTDGTFKFQDVMKDRPEGGRPHTGLTVRAHEGAQRLIVGGNADTWREVEQLHAARFNSATDLQPADQAVSNSARGALQAPIPAANLKPTDIVKLPNGYEVTAAAAVTLGHLRPRAGGGYEDTHAPAPTPAAQPQQHQVSLIDTATPLEDDGSAAVFKHGVSASLTARAVEEIATSGTMSPDVLREASQQLDADPTMVAAVMQKAMAAYGQQFERHAVKAGVTPSDFNSWAQTQRADALKLAMVAHVTRQDPRSYNTLLAEFKQASRR